MENYIIKLYLISFLFYLFAMVSKRRIFPGIALSFLAAGFLGSLYLIIQHLFQVRRLPLTNTSETLLSAVAIVVFIFLILEFKKRQLNLIGLFVSFVSSVGLMAAFWFLKRPLMPLLPALQSRWLVFHVTSCIIAYCFFTISFITAIIYLVKKYPEPNQAIFLSRLCHRCICLGFFLLTLGIILGSIWGKFAWGHWWNWDPKETWALVTWLIYAYYIQGCIFGDLPKKRLIGIAILGFLACLFTYLGVNFLLKGLHSYA